MTNLTVYLWSRPRVLTGSHPGPEVLSQVHPKVRPRGSQDSSRTCSFGSWTAQEGSKTAQDASKTPQDAPKRPQDSENGAKMEPS